MVELIQYALMVGVWYNAAIHSQTCGSCGGFARASQADFRVFHSQPIRAQHFFVCFFRFSLHFIIQPNNIALRLLFVGLGVQLSENHDWRD